MKLEPCTHTERICRNLAVPVFLSIPYIFGIFFLSLSLCLLLLLSIGKLLVVVFILIYQYNWIVQVNWNNEYKSFYGHNNLA